MSVRSLPTGWKKSVMGEIGQYLNGFAFNSKTWGTTGRPIIRIQNLTGSGDSFNYFDGDIDDRYVVRNGDLLFSWAATLGVFVWSGPEAVLNQHIFKVKSLINSSFHRYLIEHNIALMTTQTHGTGMVHLTKKKFDAIPVEIPPRDEQERIVEILEEQLSRLDAAVKSVQTVREKAAQFRRSLLRATLHGRAVSENWAWHCLGEVSQMSLGKMLDRKHETGRFATRYLRNINVRWGQFDLRDLAQMDIAPHELERVSLRSGDVVVCEGGEPGRAAVWSLDEPIAIQKALHRVRPSRDLSSRFLAYLFETEFRGSSEHALFTGTTIAHLPKEKLRNLKIPFPSFQKQEEVADFLDEQVSWLNSALVAADEVERKTNALRRSLLHAAFTGELTRSWRESHV